MNGKTNRAKGHSLEREIARMFREELDFKFAKTSREASRLLDNCKVDIAGIPFLIQTKAGYSKARPKADVIFKQIDEKLLENYPKEDPIHTYPKVLIHKMNGRHRYHNLVTMPYNDFKYILMKTQTGAG